MTWDSSKRFRQALANAWKQEPLGDLEKIRAIETAVALDLLPAVEIDTMLEETGRGYSSV
jgi:hypothetical protein